MEHIKNTIEALIGDLQKQNEKCSLDKIEDVFKKSLTPKEAPHIKFSYFKKGVLAAKIDSSAWHYYFNLQKKRLLTRISGELPDVKDIKFSIGDVFKKSGRTRA